MYSVYFSLPSFFKIRDVEIQINFLISDESSIYLSLDKVIIIYVNAYLNSTPCEHCYWYIFLQFAFIVRVGSYCCSINCSWNFTRWVYFSRQSKRLIFYSVIHESTFWSRTQTNLRKGHWKGRISRHGQWSVFIKVIIWAMVQIQQCTKSPLQLHRIRPNHICALIHCWIIFPYTRSSNRIGSNHF